MYERIIREAMQAPWALMPRYCAIIQDILRFRASGGRLSAEELQARLEAEAPRAASGGSRVSGGGAIAVIPIYGVVAHRTFEASSGMTSAEWISALLRKAVADEEVTSILLDVSSPGGVVSGVPELAAQILAARKDKTVVAICNSLMCSAAYWLGSQATEIVSTPSGYTGSVGVYCLYEDWSQYLENEGIKINAISAGDNKLEGAFWEPMTEETRAFIQGQVDTTYADFLAAVAKGRDSTVANVKKTYGQGRVFDAKEALARGMIDRIATFDDTVSRLAKTAVSGRRVAAATKASCDTCGGSGLKPERPAVDDRQLRNDGLMEHGVSARGGTARAGERDGDPEMADRRGRPMAGTTPP
jgi:signal peptide peptidase SppA